MRLRLVPEQTQIDFIGWRKIAMALSCVLIIASISTMFVRGLNFGIDFVGGILIEVELKEPQQLQELRARIAPLPIGAVSLQEFGANNIILIRFSPTGEGSDAAQLGITQVREALGDLVKDFRRTEMVGPSIGDELKIQALEAIGIAILLLMAYIWFRFEWQFSVGAVLALLHDIIITLGFYVLTGIEFNLTSIAALLTIAGYSINDTVVIYDRIREDIRRFKAKTLHEILNFAINRTLARTVMTSMTTLLALISLATLGGAIIQDFALALIVGIIAGTYSSIFLAALFLLFVQPKRSAFDPSENDD